MLKKLIVLMFLCSIAHSATYYIAPTGNDSTGNGSTGTPWLTLSEAFTNMSGGDTLIVKDGTYTGIDNMMTETRIPPVGSPGAWTIIKAEHDGMAVFDGENTKVTAFYGPMTHVGPVYWQFEGLVWRRSTGCCFQVVRASHIKLLRCGAEDASADAVNFYLGRNADYSLMENCYAWGDGRYKFEFYQSTGVILRNCVGRMDVVENSGGPIGVFTLYSCHNAEAQNCIAIDCDQPDRYDSGGGQWAGAMTVVCTDAPSSNAGFKQCIALNVDINAGSIAQNSYSADSYLDNCIFWDIQSPAGNYLFSDRGDRTRWNSCTVGCSSTPYRLIGNGDGDRNLSMRNCVFYNNYSGSNQILMGYTDRNYDAFYLNNSTPSLMNSETNSVNPFWNNISNPTGGIKYITRIESGSNLDGQGESGADIGANATTLIGTSGTLYGETGYNTDTEVSMWPFPNEDLIKTKMAAYEYEGVVSTRGFCSPENQLNGTDEITLTSYIWEYLGNEMPADIYGESEPEEPATVGITIQGVTFTGGLRISAD